MVPLAGPVELSAVYNLKKELKPVRVHPCRSVILALYNLYHLAAPPRFLYA